MFICIQKTYTHNHIQSYATRPDSSLAHLLLSLTAHVRRQYLATRIEPGDHLITAANYNQMLYQLNYGQLAGKSLNNV